MGLGCSRSEWDDYEWFEVERTPSPATAEQLWEPDGSVRVLLCDLDNLRADAPRLRRRMRVALAIARTADVTVFAGQEAAVQRSRGALEEYAEDAMPVPNGRNVADLELLAVAAAVEAERVQFVVMSNDGIFASLAARGPLVVVSPGAAARSDRLASAAVRVLDVDDLDFVPAPVAVA